MTNTTLEKWEEKSIKQLVVLICDGDWIETKNQSFNGIRLIQTGNIGEGCYKDKTENARYISEETFKKLNCTEIFSGDCLVSRLPQPLGRACIIPYKNERMITAVDCSIIRFNNKVITPKYFIYYSMSDSYNKKVIALSTGATRQRISRKNLETITIPLPPLSEQERIVAKLDKAFEAIDKVKANAEQNLNNAKELFESALDKAFTENTEGWEEKTLEKIGNIQTGTTPKTSEKDNFGNYIPFIKPADFNPDGTLNYNNEGLSEKGLKVARFIPKNSVLMVCIGATITKTGYSEIDTTCNQQINTLTPTKDSCKFIYYAMVRKEFKEKILAGCPQTTLPIINKSNWSALTIKLPKIDEQQKIVEKLDVLQEQTKQLEQIYTQKIKECDELKQSILQKAFRGEL